MGLNSEGQFKPDDISIVRESRLNYIISRQNSSYRVLENYGKNRVGGVRD